MRRFLKLFTGNALRKYLFLAFIISTSAVAVYAATVPNSFTSGTTISSSEVNANFSYITDRSWELSGSDLTYNAGRVVIGTTTATSGGFTNTALQVNGVAMIGTGNDTDHAAISARTGSNWTEALDMYVFPTGYPGNFFDSLTKPFSALYSSATLNGLAIFTGNGALTFGTNGNRGTDEKMRITATGNVGIGTTTPTNPLEMASGAHVTTGGVWTNASSRSYKENIVKLEAKKAMDAFSKLEPVTFNYKTDKAEKYIGFIAEDVPEIVATSSRKGLSSMDVVALLTKVVQEQQKAIDALKKKSQSLAVGCNQ